MAPVANPPHPRAAHSTHAKKSYRSRFVSCIIYGGQGHSADRRSLIYKAKLMTQVKSLNSRSARLFRAMSMADKPVSGRRDLTSKEKRLCRHMAHDGASYEQMAEAIGWDMHLITLQNKLKAINIRTKGSLNRYLHSGSDYK